MENQSIRKLFSQLKIVFNMIAKNQPVAFMKQSVVFISSL